MSSNKNSRILENIFVKCNYSSHLKLSPEWRYSDTKTDYCNLVLVCGGQGIFTCENKECVVKRGDLVFFPQGVRRTMRSYNDTLEYYSFNFIYKLIFEHKLEWWEEEAELPLEFVRHIEDKALFRRFEQLFEKIQQCYAVIEHKAPYQMRFYITEILSLCLMEKRSEIAYHERNMIEKSVEYMSQHFSEKITLKELADISKKSVSYYGKIFKKIFGTTPVEYLLLMRISYAKKLLENGASVTETADMCGFSSLYYFSKAFKLRENMSPTEYKNTHSVL